MALIATITGAPSDISKASADKEQTKASQQAPKKAKQVKPKSEFDHYATAFAVSLLKEEKVFDTITLEKNGREKIIPLRNLQKELLHLGGIQTTKPVQAIDKKPEVESKSAEKKSIGESFQSFRTITEGIDVRELKNYKPIDKEKFKVFSPSKMQNDLKKAIESTKNPQVKKLYQEILKAYKNNDQDSFNSLKSQIRSILSQNK